MSSLGLFIAENSVLMTEFGPGHDKEKLLSETMTRLGVRESDLVETFTRSSGPGGQNVNKTSTCVHLKHLPTGLEVRCQDERTQASNRYTARKRLLEKIEALLAEKLARERQRLEKLRRQNRKRSQRAKARILDAKRMHAQKKRLRGAPREAE